MKSPFSLSTTACSQHFAICLLAIFFLSGCGLIQGMQEPPEEEEPKDNQPTKNDPNGDEENACGGDEELTFEGEVADEGDPCGPCDRDTLRCDDNDEEGNTLVCEPGGTACEGPENVEATTDLVDEVEVTWEHVDGADEYVIYRDGDKMDTISVGDVQEGARFEFIDDEPSLATPLAPENFEASDGESVDSIELSWEFDEETMLPDGDEHQYAVVAVYDEFEDGDSDPVEVTGHTVGRFDDDYQFRRDGGDWINFSNPPCENNECQRSDEVDGDEGPNLPQIVAADINATEKAAEYEITVEVEDIELTATPTDYQLRAVSDTGVSGEAEDAQGHLDMRDVYAQFERADDDDGDAQDFEPVGDSQRRDVEFDENDEQYRPTEPFIYEDMPQDEEPYHYRVTLWPDDYEEQSLTSDSTIGQRGSPRLFSTSNDNTLRSIYPSGTEAWSESSLHGYVFLATDPDGNIYATGDESKTSVSKFDSEGNLQWEFDEPDDSVNYVAASNHGFVYATSEHRVYRIDEDDKTEFDYWETDDDRIARGVIADADGHVYVAIHDDEDDEDDEDGNGDGENGDGENGDGEDDEEYNIKKLLFADELGDDVDVEWDIDTAQPTMVIAGGNGYLYWGTTESSVKRVEIDSETPQEDVETIEFNWTMEILGLAITPEGRLYVAGFNPPPSTYMGSYLKWIDSSFENFSEVIPYELVQNLAVNQISVDPMGNVYFGTSASFSGANEREERIFKLDDTHDEVWVFDGHFADDSTVFHGVSDIIVTPGFYGTFPDAWHDIQDQLD